MPRSCSAARKPRTPSVSKRRSGSFAGGVRSTLGQHARRTAAGRCRRRAACAATRCGCSGGTRGTAYALLSIESRMSERSWFRVPAQFSVHAGSSTWTLNPDLMLARPDQRARSSSARALVAVARSAGSSAASLERRHDAERDVRRLVVRADRRARRSTPARRSRSSAARASGAQAEHEPRGVAAGDEPGRRRLHVALDAGDLPGKEEIRPRRASATCR